MNNNELEKLFSQSNEIDFVRVEGDGYHYQVTIVSDVFIGKTKVARQQWVYAKIKDFITTGGLHAVSMKTFTKKEWDRNHG